MRRNIALAYLFIMLFAIIMIGVYSMIPTHAMSFHTSAQPHRTGMDRNTLLFGWVALFSGSGTIIIARKWGSR